MMKRCFLLITAMLLLMGACCVAQVTALPVEKVDSCMRTSAKPVVMLLTTDWCKYCQLQKAQLRKNRDFQEKAGKFFYVEFDAEGKKQVTFHGHTYRYKATGVSTGEHELAVALCGDEGLSFPTWVVLDKNYQLLFRYNGVMSPQQLKELLDSLDKM